MNRADSLGRIHHYFRRLQRSNRAVGSASGSELSLAESHLLTEIEVLSAAGTQGQAATQANLARILSLTRQELSRLSARLRRMGLIRATAAKRSQTVQLSLSARGRRVIKKIDRSANAQLEILCAPLSEAELQLVYQVMQEIADYQGVPNALSRPGEMALRAQVRRVTRSFKLITSRIFGVPILPLDWHILGQLSGAEQAMSIGELATALGAQHATTGYSLARLEDRDCVVRLRSAADQRLRLFELSPKGVKLLQQVEQRAVVILSSALEQWLPSKLKAVERALAIMSGGSKRDEFRELRSEAQRQQARWLFVKWALDPLSPLRKRPDFPEILYARANRAFGLLGAGGLIASCEVIEGVKGRTDIAHPSYNRREISAERFSRFLAQVRELIKNGK